MKIIKSSKNSTGEIKIVGYTTDEKSYVHCVKDLLGISWFNYYRPQYRLDGAILIVSPKSTPTRTYCKDPMLIGDFRTNMMKKFTLEEIVNYLKY